MTQATEPPLALTVYGVHLGNCPYESWNKGLTRCKCGLLARRLRGSRAGRGRLGCRVTRSRRLRGGLSEHVSLVMQCRREGHPAFRLNREIYQVNGRPYAFRVCVRCHAGVDPVPANER